MAISYVGGVQGGRAGATGTTTQSLSGTLAGGSNTSPSAGDLVVVFCAAGADTTAAPTQSVSGNNNGAYTQLTVQSQLGTTYDSYHLVSYKIQGSTVDTSITIPSSGSVRNAQRWRVMVFRDVDPTTPMDATATYAKGTATGRPNPAAITPSTAGAWICAFYTSSAGTGAAYTSPGLSGWLGANTADTADCMTGSGYYSSWSSGAYDPPAITAGGTTNAADSWTATTIALKPAATVVNIAAQETNFTLTADNGTVQQTTSVTGAESNLTLTADNGTVESIVATTIDAQESNYTLSADNGTVTQTTNLTGAESSFTLRADSGTLAITTTITGQECNFTLTADNGTVESITTTTIVANESSFTLTAENGVVIQTTNLQPADTNLSLTADNGTLAITTTLQANESTFNLIADNGAIQTSTTLTPADSSFILTAGEATLAVGAVILADDTNFTFTADNGTIIQTTDITADEGLFTLRADAGSISDGTTPDSKVYIDSVGKVYIIISPTLYLDEQINPYYVINADLGLLEKV